MEKVKELVFKIYRTIWRYFNVKEETKDNSVDYCVNDRSGFRYLKTKNVEEALELVNNLRDQGIFAYISYRRDN